jgi:hypothetical protein
MMEQAVGMIPLFNGLLQPSAASFALERKP